MHKHHCSHYANTIFLKCPDHNINKHLHCGSCGIYLKHSIKLTKATTNYRTGPSVEIHLYHGTCAKLTLRLDKLLSVIISNIYGKLDLISQLNMRLVSKEFVKYPINNLFNMRF